ncbi:MAG: ExbD/TolR family protein [Burkholderiales bacterium]|jgi:biopolymer transport protein TolR|nr:ExbD/TolR family protein [Burkholderiales bacterium]MCA3215896.1 ExbD/TolR family protein [Burkholderiales bacterium]MCA3225020.1 ExbD/TolR family protein [Burkholderiales bacterium]
MAILARRNGPRRRMLADINVVPYIDVMLVLVVILMVSAPFVNPSLVNLPSVGKSSRVPDRPLEVVIRANGSITLRDGQKDLAQGVVEVAERVRAAQQANAAAPRPVVIAADKDVKYEHVMNVMDRLQKAGVQRVGLSVRPAG